MKKLILIDGNSLLNRAFYAMSLFTTKDGLPTNGIFGFVKLILKIIDDERPSHFAVAFDLHAPTFRHKMYDGYKATRKPMPKELSVQVPVLKDLLRAMRIRTVELEGYEADDLLGTVSRMFEDVHVMIYTGDRDAYQLVKKNVDVCYTKRGVTDIEHLTEENFSEKVGLAPYQIVEEKALMGDASDNIPGVRGIGPKTAVGLLRRFGTVKAIYDGLEKIETGVRAKLEAGRDSAALSHKLAAIDCNVPLDLSLEDCLLELPFPEEARAFCASLEFRSLVTSSYFPAEIRTTVRPAVVCTDLNGLERAAAGAEEFAFCRDGNMLYLAFNGQDYLLRVKESFLGDGFLLNELRPLLGILFSGDKRAILSDAKAVGHFLDGAQIPFTCKAEDVTLLRYLCDSNNRTSDAKEFALDQSLPESNRATALIRAFHDTMNNVCGKDEENLYRDLELPLGRVLLDMERFGVRVDLGKFPEFSEKFRKELKDLSEVIYSMAGEPFNINSPFQLSEMLFERLGLDPKGAKKNARGGYSTSAEVLEKLAEEYEIVRLILRYRELQKLQSTYIEGIRPFALDGIVHTTYHQTMTTTGRLSSSDPNLQNIPVRTEEGKELRKLFIAREGNIFIDADYSQIELRLLAHFSKCKALTEAYRNNEDIHAATAARVFSTSLSEVTPAMRRRAKTINFGIIYGMSPYGLAKDLGCSPSDAREYITKYFEAHPEVKEYMDENVRQAKECGYVKTILGRKRYIPEIRSSNFNTRSFGERAAMNMPLQGSAADIIKIAMLRVSDRLKREGSKAKLVLQVHDELVLDAPLEEAEQASAILKEEMEKAISLDVPLIADVSRGRSWYDAK